MVDVIDKHADTLKNNPHAVADLVQSNRFFKIFNSVNPSASIWRFELLLRFRQSVSLLPLLMPFYSSTVLTSPVDRDAVLQQRQSLQRSITPSLTAVRHPEEQPSGTCFVISSIELSGAEYLPSSAERELTNFYLRRCLSLDQIQMLVRLVSDWYISRGYITSYAFFTEQDLSHGHLRLQVFEGKLEDIELEKQDALMLRTAFPGLRNKILNTRDIEQGMESINRLRKVPVQIEILPGNRAGYSIVNLTDTPEFPLKAGIDFDNSGQRSTGSRRVVANYESNGEVGPLCGGGDEF